MLSFFCVNNSFVYWNFEWERFFYRYDDVLDHFKWNLFNFGYANLLSHGVRYRLFDRDRNLFYNRDDYCFRYGYLDRNGVWDGN